MRTIAVALGGNALIRHGQRGTFEEQLATVSETCSRIAELVGLGHHVVITHGNGPQVGNILLQQEAAQASIPAMPLDACGAESQGLIGYMLQRTLGSMLHKPVVTLVTQVVVDGKDPAFAKPTKPIGPFYGKAEAEKLAREKGWKIVEQAGKGWRRVVASPDPKEIVEKDVLKRLVRSGAVVIASGGGGIPVIREDGRLQGVEAVIDKDLAAERLAAAVGADALMILTDVERVALNYRKPNQRMLERLSVKEAERYYAEGHFPPGSMGPKILAAIRFLRNGGERAIITSPAAVREALRGKAGTLILYGGGLHETAKQASF